MPAGKIQGYRGFCTIVQIDSCGLLTYRLDYSIHRLDFSKCLSHLPFVCIKVVNCSPSPCERFSRFRFYGNPCRFRVLGLLWELCNHARLHGFRLSPVAYVEIAFRVVGCDFRHLPHSRGCRALDITRFYKMEIEAPKHPAFQLLSLAGQDFPRL